MNTLAKQNLDELSPKKAAELIRVDFRPEELRKAKRMVILYPEGDEEERPLLKKPTLAEMMAIVGGFPARCSVRLNGQTRSMVYNSQGCCKPYRLNVKATELRPLAMIDPLFQVWGPAIILYGFRLGRI